MKHKSYFILALILGCIFIGCAFKMTKYYVTLNNLIVNNNYSQALNMTEESKDKIYGDKNSLLYYLDKGLLLQLDKQYKASNEAFEKAKTLAEKYFTKSITTEATTLLVSDNTRPYYGEDFERVLINIFCALNYIFLGNENEALVEARQADFFLTKLQTDYGSKSVYKEDPFARYLMGLIYEDLQNENDARISYLKAIQAYEAHSKIYPITVPKELTQDYLRSAKYLGIDDDTTKDIEKKYGAYKNENDSDNGELVVLHYNGIAPEKVDSIFEISFGKAWAYVDNVSPKGEEEQEVNQAAQIARNIFAEDQIVVAFPKYITSPYNVKNSLVEVCVSTSDFVFKEKESVLADNIGGLAVESLKDRINRTKAKAIARAAIKYALANAVGNKVKKDSGDDVLAWFAKKAVSTVSNVTEKADKRCWRLLPDQIRLTRLSLPEGKYSVTLILKSADGNELGTVDLDNQIIRKQHKTFVVVRTGR
jgi:uncharacterized protein